MSYPQISSHRFNRLKGKAIKSCKHGVLAVAGGVAAVQAASVTTQFHVSRTGIRSSKVLEVNWKNIGNSYSVFGWQTLTTTNGVVITTSQSVFGISEAKLGVDSHRTTGGAFDVGMTLFVNGKSFENPDNTVDVTDGVVTSDWAVIDEINTQIKYRFFGHAGEAASDRAAARALYTLINTAAVDKTVDILIGGNLDSDSDTTVQQTSNGDRVLDSSDYWVYSNDNTIEGGEPQQDRGLIITKHGDYAEVIATHAFEIANPTYDTDNYGFRYRTTIAAGETVTLLHFVEMVESNAIAAQQAVAYESLDTLSAAGLLDGLTQEQINQLINYGAEPPAQPVTDVEKGAFNISALFLLAIAGFWRRKSRM